MGLVHRRPHGRWILREAVRCASRSIWVAVRVVASLVVSVACDSEVRLKLAVGATETIIAIDPILLFHVIAQSITQSDRKIALWSPEDVVRYAGCQGLAFDQIAGSFGFEILAFELLNARLLGKLGNQLFPRSDGFLRFD